MKNINKMAPRAIRIAILGLMLTALFASSAFADESWTSNGGKIVYQDDIGKTAVFSFKQRGSQNVSTLLFIDGLVPDIMGNRGSYTGHWVDNSSRKTCESNDSRGKNSRSWGRFEITFAKDGNSHWSWTGVLGDCDDAPFRTLNAKAWKGPGSEKSLWDFRDNPGDYRDDVPKAESEAFFRYLFGEKWDKELQVSSRFSGSFTKPNALQTLYYVSACETEEGSGILTVNCSHSMWNSAGWIAIFEGGRPIMKVKAAIGYGIVKVVDVNGDGINEFLSLSTYAGMGQQTYTPRFGQISGGNYREIFGSEDTFVFGSEYYDNMDESNPKCHNYATNVSYSPTTNGKMPNFLKEYFIIEGCSNSNWTKVTEAQFDKKTNS